MVYHFDKTDVFDSRQTVCARGGLSGDALGLRRRLEFTAEHRRGHAYSDPDAQRDDRRLRLARTAGLGVGAAAGMVSVPDLA